MSVTVTQPDLPSPPPFGIPTNTLMTPDTFRVAYPEFADTDAYTDERVQLFLDAGALLINRSRWGRMAVYGVGLFCAHSLALQAWSLRSIQGGGVPGMAFGITSSKSVSKVSIGYDTSSTAMEGAGPWNYTIYGQQFYFWKQLFGVGGVEMLSYGSSGIDGLVNTWARGVFLQWGS